MENKHWWNKSVVYQIYPKSFADSNNDGIGDLQGIISKLNYLKKLGVDILWLSPIYQSPQVDNGYDISDYRAINPDFGTMADFDELITKAHALDLKIIMDLVVNHTSDQHQWFQEAKNNPNSKYRDYYIWRDGKNGQEPTNWGGFFGGSAWTYDQKSQQYYLHLFAPEQPDLNWENSEVRESIYDMMNWWAAKGVDGFRMDVINYISKPEIFSDGKKLEHEWYANPEPIMANGHKIHQFLQEMNREVMSHYQMVTVGETPGVTPEEALKYSSLDNQELNMVFQFEHMGLDGNDNPVLGRWSNKKTSLKDLRDNLTKWQQKLAGKAWNSLYWNNHDQPRVVSRFGDDSTEEYRVLSAKMLATMLHFMQGTPFIFEGEEIGMPNANFTDIDDYEDLDSINPYHQFVDEQHLVDEETMMTYIAAHSRDNARTPMPWNNNKNGGFSDHDPWFKLNPSFTTINVEQALADPHSVFYYYQQLIRLRHTLPVITDGRYSLVEGNADDDQVYAYYRKNDQTTLLVILNYTKETLVRQYDIPANAKLLISNYPDDQGSSLRAYEAKVYQF